MQQLLAAANDWLLEPQTLFGQLLGWLKEWQILAGSLIAVLAAAITVNAINRQIRLQSFEATEARRRRVQAFRASMPEDLQAICSYSLRSANVGRDALLIINADEDGREVPSSKGRQNRLKCPVLPTHVPANLKALIEHLDDPTAAQITDLVRCYYSQRAQLAGALENFNQSSPSTITVSKTINFNPVFKDTLELYLRAKGILPFAKGETENIVDVFGTAEILNAMKVLNIDYVMSPEAKEYCFRFLANSAKQHSLGRILSRR